MRLRLRRAPLPVQDGVDLGLLQTLLCHSPDTPVLIFEIGANNGSDTLRLLKTFPTATIKCFEPDPRAIELWRGSVDDSRASLDEIAIGLKDGTTSFFASSGAPRGQEHNFPDGWHLSGSIRRPTGHLELHPWCEFTAQSPVPVRSLDSWAQESEISAVDLIWADVQGAEADLIGGGQETLSRTRFLYTEYSDEELYEGQRGLSQILEMLPGWSVHTRYSGDVLLVNDRLANLPN
jgi:2-O-methyltransferase